jgi:hypothetical protein
MTDPKRSKVTYATADGKHALVVDFPFGLILPPTIETHIPLVGPVIFYWADCHHIKVEREAKRRGLGVG